MHEANCSYQLVTPALPTYLLHHCSFPSHPLDWKKDKKQEEMGGGERVNEREREQESSASALKTGKSTSFRKGDSVVSLLQLAWDMPGVSIGFHESLAKLTLVLQHWYYKKVG